MKHQFKDTDEAINYIESVFAELPKRAREVCQPVFNDPKFWAWPASLRYHHSFYSGLVKHTGEVLQLSLDMGSKIVGFDKEVVAVAVVFHDSQKTKDYTLIGTDKPNEKSRWEWNEHGSLIGHINRAYSEFMISNFKRKLYTEEEQQIIGSIILSHHGRSEWGSNIEPQNFHSAIVHFSDMLSSQYLDSRV